MARRRRRTKILDDIPALARSLLAAERGLPPSGLPFIGALPEPAPFAARRREVPVQYQPLTALLQAGFRGLGFEEPAARAGVPRAFPLTEEERRIPGLRAAQAVVEP